MPTYEYKCLECGKTFEEFQNMTDDPLTECRFCQGEVKRLIGAGAGLIFKGSGFYCTDYRSSSYQTEARKAKSAPASDASSGSSGDSASSGSSESSGAGSSDASS